jgi:hypothetical protein
MTLLRDMLIAPDWESAYRLAAATLPSARDGVAVSDPPASWEIRRPYCLQMSAFVRNELKSSSTAAAWAILGADPAGPGWRKREGYENYGQVLRGIADAIVAEPSLTDDEAFREAVDGWRFLEHAGSDGDEDLIVSARRYGAMGKADAAEILSWAQRWKTQ